jgi:hypothetical protein
MNPNPAAIDLSGWFVLMSPDHGLLHLKSVLPAGTTIPANGFLVLGGGTTPPPEMPGTAAFVGSMPIPFSSLPFECALYDDLGRLIDLVRTTSLSGENVHNFPRAPSHPLDFSGAGNRDSGGDAAMGRNNATGFDMNLGSDFFPIYTRTMGFANPPASLAGPGGWADGLDVRLNHTGLPGGFQAIINGAALGGGNIHNFLVSATHSEGLGIFFGLGPDALANLPLYYNVPPFSGPVNGSARIDFNPGTLPPGVDADFLFVIQNPTTGAILRRTLVLEFDT